MSSLTYSSNAVKHVVIARERGRAKVVPLQGSMAIFRKTFFLLWPFFVAVDGGVCLPEAVPEGQRLMLDDYEDYGKHYWRNFQNRETSTFAKKKHSRPISCSNFNGFEMLWDKNDKTWLMIHEDSSRQEANAQGKRAGSFDKPIKSEARNITMKGESMPIGLLAGDSDEAVTKRRPWLFFWWPIAWRFNWLHPIPFPTCKLICHLTWFSLKRLLHNPWVPRVCPSGPSAVLLPYSHLVVVDEKLQRTANIWMIWFIFVCIPWRFAYKSLASEFACLWDALNQL